MGLWEEYRPLLVYTYAFDRAVGGTGPSVYHLTNTVIHVANALLVAAISIALARYGLSPF